VLDAKPLELGLVRGAKLFFGGLSAFAAHWA
jgi:hypothetical protein